jgi:hypothetical protein
MNNFELTENPSIIFQAGIMAKDIEVFGLKLFNDCSGLNIEDMADISLEKGPAEAVGLFGGEDKSWYYLLNGKKLKFSWEERFESAIKNGGCLHLKNHTSLVIDEGRIAGIRVYCEQLNLYSAIQKNDIQNLLGTADEIIEERYAEEPDMISMTSFIFKSKLIAVEFDDYSSKKIIGLFLGEFPFALSRNRK